MTMSTSTPPTRRSALESIHRALSRAPNVAPTWPISYGDVDGERAAVGASIGLAEPGLYDKLVVRGRGALAACRAAGLDGQPGRVTPAPPGGVNVWTIADDELWLVAYAPLPGGPQIPAVDFRPIASRLTAAGTYVTDVSSGLSVLRLVGPRVRDLLEELVAENLSADAVADQTILQVPMAGCRVILARRDYDTIPGFTLLVPRDDAAYLWEVLSHLGEAYGIRPVGAAALLPVAPSMTAGAR